MADDPDRGGGGREEILRRRLEALARELTLVTSVGRAEELLREQETLQRKLTAATIANRNRAAADAAHPGAAQAADLGRHRELARVDRRSSC